MDPTNSFEIKTIISNLKNSMSAGPDGIPTNVIKSICSFICDIISHLINSSLSTGIFPDELKNAKITPIYKSDEKDVISNYRPISVLNVVSNIFEKAIYSRLINFMDKFNIISDAQFGFRKRHSTFMPVLLAMDKIIAAKERNEYSLAIFLDLKKAFDTINYDILFVKLQHYGVRGIAL